MDPLTLALMLGGSALSFFGPDPMRRAQSNQVNNLNRIDQELELFRMLGLSAFDPGRQELLNQLGLGPLDPNQQSVFGGLQGLAGETADFRAQIPGLFQNALQTVDPRTLGPQATEVFDAAQQDIQNRGNTEQLSFIEDRARDLFNAGLQGTAPAAQAGLDIIQSGGQTPESIQLSQEMMDIIQSGGQTGETREMFGSGMDLVNSGGFTPELRELQSSLQSQLRAGGLTPEARRVLNPLTEIIESGGAGGGLLGDDAAISLARDAAATASAQQGEAVRRQALQRGSGPGTLAGSGLQNQLLAEFGDASAQAEAAAVREAAFNQQNARLQQLGIATSGAGSILSDASRILASANAGLGDIARASSFNLATGAGLASDSQRIASQNLGLGIGGFNQNQANEIARLGTGGDIFGTALGAFGDLSQVSLRALLDVEGARRDQQNMAADQLLGLGDQARDARGQNILGTGQMSSDMLQSLGLGGTLFGQGGNLATAGRGQLFGGAGTLLGSGTSILGMNPSLLSSRTATLGGFQPGNTGLQQLGGDITRNAGSIGSVIGDIFGFGGPSKTAVPFIQPFPDIGRSGGSPMSIPDLGAIFGGF